MSKNKRKKRARDTRIVATNRVGFREKLNKLTSSYVQEINLVEQLVKLAHLTSAAERIYAEHVSETELLDMNTEDKRRIDVFIEKAFPDSGKVRFNKEAYDQFTVSMDKTNLKYLLVRFGMRQQVIGSVGVMNRLAIVYLVMLLEGFVTYYLTSVFLQMPHLISADRQVSLHSALVSPRRSLISSAVIDEIKNPLYEFPDGLHKWLSKRFGITVGNSRLRDNLRALVERRHLLVHKSTPRFGVTDVVIGVHVRKRDLEVVSKQITGAMITGREYVESFHKAVNRKLLASSPRKKTTLVP